MTLHPALARLARGARRLYWDAPKRLMGMNTPGWPTAPVDEGHATYRRQYEALLPTLPHLPRGVNHENAAERRKAILFLAELVDGLHNYGDDPIMPPGIRRIVVRETERMAALGEVGQPRRFLPGAAAPWMGLLLSPWTWLVALGAFCVLQMGLKERVENQRDEARRELADAEESLLASVELTRRLQRDITAANQDSSRTAETIEAERARRLAAEREARRIRNEMERARAGAGSVDYGFGSVRDTGAGGSPGSGGSDTTGRDPG